MMDNLEDFIESNCTYLLGKSEFNLRENLAQLEQECRSQYKDQNQDELSRIFWLHLVKLSLKLKNINIALTAVAKLKLVQLALLLRSLVQPPDKRNQLIGLHYVANYFHHESLLEPLDPNEPFEKTNDSLFGQDSLIKFYIYQNDWDEAVRIVENRSSQQKYQIELNRRRVVNRLAFHHEIDENFPAALTNYEESKTQDDNAARVIIKQFMDLAYQELKKYCSATKRLQNFWFAYSSIVRKEIDDNTPKIEIYSRFVLSEPGKLFDLVFKTIPEKMRKFILNKKADKWSKKKEIECIFSLGESLSPDVRRNVACLAEYCHQTNLIPAACSLYLCLNQVEAFLNLLPKYSSRIHSFATTNLLGSPARSALETKEYLIHNIYSVPKEKHASQESQNIFLACLKLGLIDESLCIFSMDAARNERSICTAVEYLDGIIENRYSPGSLDNIDPEISSSTLKTIQQSLKDGPILATHVITVVILSLTILLFKLDTYNMSMVEKSVPKVEQMFENLSSNYLDGLNFNASSALVRAVNFLVAAIKSKLDALAENDIIRDGFKFLVERVAERCMIEGQYKSAAMLYSQIEDNVSAIKSLMRTGDVDVVTNYSLLVRDITVNRITINYLKHLNVDAELIEDFISKTKL